MVGQVLSIFSRPKSRDWSQQELAEFYRVESALVRSGLRVETDRGLTDEGEPWFVFCKATDGEVVIHFARCDGQYLVAGPGYERVARGLDFPSLVKDLVAGHPLVNAQTREKKSNVIMHPTALLIAVVAAALLKNGEAHAKSGDGDSSDVVRERDAAGGHGGTWFSSGSLHSVVTVDVRHLAVVMSAISIALPSNHEDGSSTTHVASLTPSLEDSHNPDGATGGSETAHVYGLEASLLDRDHVDETALKPGGEMTSPAEKLQVLSLATILLDLPAKEDKSSEIDSFSTHGPSAERDVHSSDNTLSQPEAFIRIELAKGSGELPSIQNVTQHGEQTDMVMPVSLAVLQPFLDHAVKIHAAGQSAVDVLQPLTLDGTVNAAILSEFKNELQVSDTVATASTPGVSGIDAQHNNLPHEGWVSASDAASITSAIERFVHEEGYKVALGKHDVIFYDPHAFGGATPDLTVTSLKWEFQDGSSITLIGHLSNLHLDQVA